jgi:hypothetical protein
MDLPLCSAVDWTIVELLNRLQSDEPIEEDTGHYFSSVFLFPNGTSIFLMTSGLPIC